MTSGRRVRAVSLRWHIAGAAVGLGALFITFLAGQSAVDEAYTGPEITIEVLSRGRGVPRRAWEALKEVEQRITGWRQQGILLSSEKIRIGLEGETRLCLEFAEASQAQQIWRQLKERYEEVDLMRMRRGRCPDR